MEPDGSTRLYYYHEHPSVVVKEAWPQPVGWGDGTWTEGREAQEIYDRADFVCVNVHISDRESGKTIEYFWSVGRKGEDSRYWFKVNRVGIPHDQDYANLARQLEEKTKRKGLTVLIS